ncbi:xanthine dehydrogenase family protein subunit M [Breoghania sp.]|uniref:FAD binding domain-containing protein n=1 Tax=Breoghania sp. TaxID=2065378 RepID=UPI002610DC2E|nr:xanthine dehydrogenase family protein subunit M [Breoghania sp.]MDJ0929983.1 xanthine dehydrogenase family protein subunit M [Breoghania sp.]
MYATNYHCAGSVNEATGLLTANDEAKILPGGQTLIPTMKQRLSAPSDVIDISRIETLRGVGKDGDAYVIGAGTRHAEVAGHAGLQVDIPGLAALAGKIGDPHVHHRGTIGGSIANNDPAADYPAGMLGLGATIITSKREIAADDFFTGLFETALDEDEIITTVRVPVPQKSSYAKFPNPASRYVMAGVFVAKLADGSVRVAVTGAGADGIFRVPEMESALSGNWSADAVAGIAVSPADLLGDIHGSAEYRANLVTVMAKRAVVAA